MTEGDLFGDSVYESGDPAEETDDLDASEGLTGEDPDEAMQTGYSPPDREPYNLRHRPTASEARQGESLDERLAEEEPDITVEEEPDITVEEDEPDITVEEEPEITVDDPDMADPQPRAGRLVAPDEGVHADLESDEIASDVGTAGYASSAEEAAMHIIDEEEVE
jgi:Family of unknown function (DUF5709)